MPVNLTRNEQLARDSVGGGDHGLVQVGLAPGAAAVASASKLCRCGEIAVVIRCLRRHLINVVVDTIAEAQLFAHRHGQPIVRSAATVPIIGITNGPRGSGGGRERSGGRVEPKRAG